MALPANLQQQNRGPKVTVNPDLRKTVERRYDIPNWQSAYQTIDEFLAQVQLPWGTADEEYPECRLVAQNVVGQTDDPYTSPNKEPPYLSRVFDQISENDRTQVGRTDIFYDQYGRKTVVNEFLQFSDGTTVYSDVVGTSAAPAPNEACILKTIEAPNDGTLIRWKLTYIDSGELARDYDLNFGGNLIILTITSLNEIPATPAGYTLFGPGTEYIQGLPVYKYRFSAVNGGGVPGTGAEIDRNVEYFYSPDQGAVGITRTTIKYISSLSVVVNPITGPVGSELISVEYSDQQGYRMWTAAYASGTGVIKTEIEKRNDDKLVLYTLTSLNAAPPTPSPTIGGTVTLIATDVANGTRVEDGNVVYVYRFAEGNGTISTEQQGEPDGALVQTITTLSAAASTPTSPGMGWYLITLDQRAQDGCYLNRAVYKQPPPTITFKKKVNFTKPGVASIGGSPIQLSLSSQVTMTLLADVEVSYDEAQITDAPYTTEAWAQFYESWTPTDTGIQQSSTKSLGGYLAEASGTSGTNSTYNGVLCDSWSYALISSIPSTFSAAVHVLDTDNDPYLTAIDGTVVYRRTKVSYDFS